MSYAVDPDRQAVDDGMLVCEYCGGEILEEGQECPALDDGECRP